MGLTITIAVLLVIVIGLIILRAYQFKHPQTIRWQIGHQVFTFEFPFRWMHLMRFSNYFEDVLAMIGLFVLGLIVFIAVCVFLFLFIGFILPIILVIGLIALIFFLLFIL
ncbi:hypothetical protein [Acetilactobacillus jinshanensis]|uniref:Uncharacterized protein n=1 Tax=Acetilactobacillus jinshanensis TaxID=1720083 RepID=A0A4P6ZKJ2_9LACO|nr:hypothetical protein [Acetilactobacillus jinshanensis]QBP18037.1 hypothetical protein ELX58_02495 [Acetilactobacillus jinshanensis]